ncbi:MAG TPA: hypothetical protein VFR11_07215 [Micromonosporaceae bacterium]|jgi:hypothetical protein|nr:hypothetical protein [Micromonosporaceae bacterium]
MPLPPPEPPRRVPLWLKIMSAVWAVALVVGGVWYSLHGRPTVREQTTIALAQPVVDRAIVDVVNAAGTGPLVAISGFERIGSCHVTPIRPGAEYRRVADFYAPRGTESAILQGIASHLPHRYAAAATSGGARTKPLLFADAGDYVAVAGSVPAPGVVEVVAMTGCRPEGDLAVAEPTPPTGSAELAAIGPVLAALGRPAVRTVTVASLACPSGGSLRSVAATLPPRSAPSSLATTLAPVSATPAVASAGTFAVREGSVDVVARTNGTTHAVTVTGTSRC